ncbi:unnamed protein product [Moneuplotes crassus]|uniref:Uncharacterized protein n=1 Tax=Euplotes crassus TaxID=5936 RepID=A0AAD1Y181_EUPCR|nr:unnamed protein product [Moneuplotes crassus]
MSDALEFAFEMLLLCFIEIRDYRCGMYSFWPLCCIISWGLTFLLASSPCEDTCLHIISPITNVFLMFIGIIAISTRWDCMSQNYKYLGYIVYLFFCLFLFCLHIAVFVRYVKDKRKEPNEQAEMTQRFIE